MIWFVLVSILPVWRRSIDLSISLSSWHYPVWQQLTTTDNSIINSSNNNNNNFISYLQLHKSNSQWQKRFYNVQCWQYERLMRSDCHWWYRIQCAGRISATSLTQLSSINLNIIKVKWCIYIAPFPCNMLKGALQWSVYPSGPEAYIGASGSRFKSVHVCWYSFYRPREDGKLSEL